ncbi:hypothetical protein SFC50_04255 [Bacillus infantis]|uniref:hypothetical protein n=1 Tax=Bacillus infantis TaxID=324767 RepID=UPI003981FBDB
MIKVTYRLRVEGPNEEDITLKLKRDAKRTLLEGRFSVGECICYGYNWKEETVEIYMDVFLPLTVSNEHITIEAGKKAWDATILLNFLYGFKVLNDYPYPIDIKTNQFPPEILIESKNKNINQIHRFLGGIYKHHKNKHGKNEQNLEKIYLTSINFYVKHLDALQAELYEDALLNLYKVFELIARDYYKFNKKLEVNVKSAFQTSFINFLEGAYKEKYDKNKHLQLLTKIENFVFDETLKDSRKIVMLANELNIKESEIETLQRFCKTRNSIAHGNTEENDLIFDLVSEGSFIARKILAKLVLNDSFSNTYPDLTISHYAFS